MLREQQNQEDSQLAKFTSEKQADITRIQAKLPHYYLIEKAVPPESSLPQIAEIGQHWRCLVVAIVPMPDSKGSSVDRALSSYNERIADMRRRAEESRNLSQEEEMGEHLREYRMKLIREGKTPLPIPITEEMDAQIVEEGSVPSLE